MIIDQNWDYPEVLMQILFFNVLSCKHDKLDDTVFTKLVNEYLGSDQCPIIPLLESDNIPIGQQVKYFKIM